MQVLVNRNQRGSPDGIKINVYKAGNRLARVAMIEAAWLWVLDPRIAIVRTAPGTFGNPSALR